MDHYLEIRLLADPEFSPTVLLNALFAKLHRALVEIQSDTIGMSLPDMRPEAPATGGRLRLHGTSDDLHRLMAVNWLTGMRDHIRLHGPAPIPSTVGYRNVRRVQVKSSPERLRRRLMKRKGITVEDAWRMIPDSAEKQLKLPYLTIKSLSTSQEFRLFIDHQPLVDEPVSGKFNHYGLSATATVPWF